MLLRSRENVNAFYFCIPENDNTVIERLYPEFSYHIDVNIS